MKNTIIILTVLAVGIAAFTFTGIASAEETTPYLPGNGGGNGNGGNGRGSSGSPGTGIPLEQNINLDGILDDLMSSLIASELGINVEVLKVREAAGESLVEIGLDLGYDYETISEIHNQAPIDALNQAVADGLITQSQADWMISRIDNGQYGTAANLCEEDCTQTAFQTAKKLRQGNTQAQP